MKLVFQSNIFWAFFGRIISSLSIFLLISFAAKNLSINEFASFSFIMSIIPSASIFLAFGQHLSSSKFNLEMKNFSNHIKNVSHTYIISLLIFLLIILSLFIFFYEENRDNSLLLFWVSLSIILTSFQRIISDISRSLKKFNLFVLFNGIKSNGGIVFWLFFFIILLISGNEATINLDFIFSTIALSSIISIFIFFFFKTFKIPNINNFFTLSENFGSFLKSSIIIMLTSLLIMIRTDHDIWILHFFGTAEDLSIYTPVIRLAYLTMIPISIFDTIIPNKMARLYQKGQINNLENYVRGISTKRLLTSSIIILILFFFGEIMLSTFFGEFYAQGSNILKILCLSFLSLCLLGPNGMILLMIKHEKTHLKINLFYLILSFILGTILTIKFGYWGMAINIVCITNLIHLTFYFRVKKLLKINTLPNIFFKKNIHND